MLHRPILSALFSLSLSGLAAHATTLTPQGGTVHVNTGSGFVAVDGNTPVAGAAKVMVSPGGSALVTYSNTCSVRLASGVWTIQDQPPCEQGVAMIDFTQRMNQETPPTEETGPSTTTYVVGGVVAGAAVAGAIILSQDGKDEPSSP